MIDINAHNPELIDARIIPVQNMVPANAMFSFHDGSKYPALRLYFSDSALLRQIANSMLDHADKLEQEQAK